MNDYLYVFLLACSALLSSCGRTGQGPEALAREKEQSKMVQIQNLTITGKTLTLDYRVSNPFENGIWVCYDAWVHGEQSTQNILTRIDGETVRMQLRFNVERFPGFVDPPAVAKYVRLLPGESCSGRILENLPIEDYMREERAEHKEHEKIVLHRAVFEIGYIGALGPKWDELIDSWSEKLKKEPIKPKPIIDGPYYILPVSPLLTEETLDGQLREVMYLYGASFVEKEEPAEVLITDVNIPCSVLVDNQ